MRTHRLAAIAAIAVGLAFIAISVLKPAALWDMGKVRAGREVLGELGMTLFFVILGAALAAAGVALARKRG